MAKADPKLADNDEVKRPAPPAKEKKDERLVVLAKAVMHLLYSTGDSDHQYIAQLRKAFEGENL